MFLFTHETATKPPTNRAGGGGRGPAGPAFGGNECDEDGVIHTHTHTHIYIYTHTNIPLSTKGRGSSTDHVEKRGRRARARARVRVCDSKPISALIPRNQDERETSVPREKKDGEGGGSY